MPAVPEALPRKRPRWLRWLKWPGIMIVCWATIIPSLHALLLRHRIISVLDSARSVRLEEFQPTELGSLGGKVFHRKELSAGEWKAVASSLPPVPDIGHPGLMALCYMPHHRVVMTDADGRKVSFEICFGCDELSFDHGAIMPTPLLWCSSLRRLFTDRGIPIRTRSDYMKLLFPER